MLFLFDSVYLPMSVFSYSNMSSTHDKAETFLEVI